MFIPPNPPTILQNSGDSVRTELEAMFEADQKGRLDIEAAKESHGHFSPEVADLWKKQTLNDEKNRKRLVEIIDQSGWPKQSVVGEKAALSAFLVLQHVGLALQKRYLSFLRTAAESGEAKLKWLALLEDRVLVGEGKKQLYGTQLIEIQGAMEFDLNRLKMRQMSISDELKWGLGHWLST